MLSLGNMESVICPLKPKYPGSARILHLSDLHFEADYKHSLPDHFKLVKSRLQRNKKKFDLIVMTGDLIDNIKELGDSGKLAETFKAAESFLVQICEAVQVDPSLGLIVIPGNHDYRYAGFIESTILDGRWRNWLLNNVLGYKQGMRKTGSADVFSTTIGKKYFKNAFYPELKVAICSFDSNTPDWVMNFATGFVDVDQIIAARDLLDRWASGNPAQMNASYRIALIHHHPMPLAESDKAGKERDLTGFEEFLLLRNSGSFLRRSLEADFGLVLHGHRHCGGFWRPATHIDGKLRSLNIVAGGALGKRGPNNQYSYNSITVFDDGYVEARRIDLDASGEFKKAYLPLSTYEDVRIELFERIARQGVAGGIELGLRADSVLRRIEIQPTGDLKLEETQMGLRSNTPQPVPHVDAARWSPSDRFHELQYSSPDRHITLSDVEYVQQHYKYRINFDRPVDQEKIQLHWSAEVGDAVMPSKEDQETFCGELLDEAWKGTEWLGFHADQVYERAVMAVTFPDRLASYLRSEIQVRVTKMGDLKAINDRETNCEHVDIHWIDGQRVILSIYRPLPGFMYMLWWNLPDRDLILQYLPLKVRLLANRVERTLSRMQPGASELVAFLEGLIANVERLPVLQPLDKEDVTSALMLRAHDEAELRCYASLSPPGDEIWNWKCKCGEGIVGHAFRRRDALPSIRVEGLEVNQFYTSASDPAHTVLYAVPLLIPVREGRPIGVFALLTKSRASWVNMLAEEAVRRAVGSTVLEYYSQNFLRAISITEIQAIPLDPPKSA